LGDKWLRLGVMLVLLAGLAQQVSLIFWHYYPVPEMAIANQKVRDQAIGASSQSTPNYQQQAVAISHAFLFGKAVVE